jgi:mannose-6-phosphate isomerase-like protein (cupin superfamily)
LEVTRPIEGDGSGRYFPRRAGEVYFVHRGRLEFEFGDGSKHVLGEGGIARVDPATVRKMKNVGGTDAV